MTSKHNWIAGTLELSSKVRYGLTSRGVPRFRFIPYNKDLPPYAVGCSQKDLSRNIHVIIQPEQGEAPGQAYQPLKIGNLIQNLGPPSEKSEKEILLVSYAYDNRKDLRIITSKELPPPFESEQELPITNRIKLQEGFTFHIDPPGCRDVDDSFTFVKISDNPEEWIVYINISDVAELIPEGTELDSIAKERATSFYTNEGEAIVPMLPVSLSEKKASLLPGTWKPTVSLSFLWNPSFPMISDKKFLQTISQTTRSFTYEEAQHCKMDEMIALKELSAFLGSSTDRSECGIAGDSHRWVQNLMILYNSEVGKILEKEKLGILRKQNAAQDLPEKQEIPSELRFLTLESAEFCSSKEINHRHSELGLDAYAYASSPIRRYADLYNQRILKKLLNAQSQEESDLGELLLTLNRRQKQAKKFSRDLFFMESLINKDSEVEGQILYKKDVKEIFCVWIPSWKRMVNIPLTAFSDQQENEKEKENEPRSPLIGSKRLIRWYTTMEKSRWNEKIVFKVVN